MIQGVGQGGLTQVALEAARQSFAQRAGRVDEQVAAAFEGLEALGSRQAATPSFETTLLEGLAQADKAVKSSEAVPMDMLTGKVADFHEVAGQLKQSEIVFKFSLEVRNKLIDAYRETMRMSV
ncbi:MAG: flagellar hook-basal body complex protein FliE [Planctomycetes bacterium]|nr:flagellar hook-basal body complex protein FliE [Planctomycetota bacterium]